MSTVITPFQGTDSFSTATFNNRISQINTGFSYISNPNLLDNWYFGNPVNQRGQTSYTGAGYGIDRFYTDDTYGTTRITDEGLVLVSGQNHRPQAQFFDFVVKNDTKVTFSALYKGDIILDYWGFTGETKHADDWSVTTLTYTIPAGTNLANRFYCPSFKALRGSTCTVKAVKLELGPTQTLAHQENGVWVLNEIPDFGEQLRRCRRYYYDSRFGRVNESDGAYSVTLTTSNAYLVGNYRFPVTMRAKPGITIYSFHGTRDRVSYWASSADLDIRAGANELTVGMDGFNAVQLATATADNFYGFHIVANAEL